MSPSKCDYSADIEHGRRRFFKRRNLMCYSWAASDNKSIDARVCVSRQWKINRAFGYIWFVQSARIVGLNVCARHCAIIRIVNSRTMKSKMQIHTDRWDAKLSIEHMKLSRSMAGDALHLLQGPRHVLSVGIGFRFAHMRCILGELVASIYFCSTTLSQSDERRLIWFTHSSLSRASSISHQPIRNYFGTQ